MAAAMPLTEEAASSRKGGLTRRWLLWAGGALAPASLLLGAVFLRRPRPPAQPTGLASPPSTEWASALQRAARLAALGQHVLARAEVSAILTRAPEHAPALLVLTCIALEEGAVREAEHTLDRLKTLFPGLKEPRLLEGILARRQRTPTMSWSGAFLETWNEQGRPDFERAHLLAGVDFRASEGEPDARPWLASTSVPVRTVLALALRPLNAERAQWLLERVPSIEEPALLVAASSVLANEALPAALRAKAAPALRGRLEQLARLHPRSMQLRLLLHLMDTPEEAVLRPRELEALEAVTELPVWREFSFAQVFLDARRHLRAAGVLDASRQAFEVATLCIADRGSYLVRRRAKTTRGQLLARARGPLGHVVHAVGARMAEQSTLLERTLGLLMMKQGAEDMQEPGELAKADALLDEAHSAQANWRKAAIDRWPLHALREEVLEASARDEMGYLGTFMVSSARP